MHCAACVGKVERALQGVPGVENARWRTSPPSAPPSGSTPSGAGLPALREAVAAAGYRVPEEIAATPEAADRERAERAARGPAARAERSSSARRCPCPSSLGSMPTSSSPGRPVALRNPWLLLALTTPVQFWVGWEFHVAFLQGAAPPRRRA